VALPGGLKEETDGNDLLVTLKREVFEEIGIAPAAIDWCTDSWDSMMSLHKIEVHPFLGFLKNSLESHASLQLNPGEVQEAEWIPLRQLFDESLWEFRSYPDAFTSHGFRMPVWKGWRWETWGLTAAVLNIFVSRISGRSPY